MAEVGNNIHSRNVHFIAQLNIYYSPLAKIETVTRWKCSITLLNITVHFTLHVNGILNKA